MCSWFSSFCRTCFSGGFRLGKMAERSIFSPASKASVNGNEVQEDDDVESMFRTPSSKIGYHLGLPSTFGPIVRRNSDGSVSMRPHENPPSSPFQQVSFADVKERADRARAKFAQQSRVVEDFTPLLFGDRSSLPRSPAGNFLRSIFDTPGSSLMARPGAAEYAIHGRRIVEKYNESLLRSSRVGSPAVTVASDAFRGHSQPSLYEMMQRDKGEDNSKNVSKPRITEFNAGLLGTVGNTPVSAAISRAAADGRDTRVVVAVVEGRGEARGEVGIAGIDLNRPVLTLCQVSDSQAYSKLVTIVGILNPIEVLVSSSIVERGGRDFKIVEEIGKEIPGVTFTAVPRSMFDAARGRTQLRRICTPDCAPILAAHEEKYYCVAAAAAVLSYAEVNLNALYEAGSTKISFHTFGNSVLIDAKTAKNLEILSASGSSGNEQLSKKTGPTSLLAVLQSTRTKCGARLLRANLLQPPFDVKVTEQRLDCVEELCSNEQFFRGLQAILVRWVEVDTILTVCALREKGGNAATDGKVNIEEIESKINAIVRLKQVLLVVAPLLQELKAGQNELFVQLANKLEDPRFDELLACLRTTIRDDVRVQAGSVAALNQRVFCIKPKVNGFLDVSVTTYKEVTQEMEKYVEELADKENLSMELANNASRGFHVRVLGRRVEKDGAVNAADGTRGNFGSKRSQQVERQALPSYFLRVKKAGNNWACTTAELVFMNQKARNAIHHAQLIIGEIIKDVVQKVRGKIACLYDLSEVVATVDLLVCLANYRIFSPNVVRPKFTTSVTEVISGRHPVLDKLSPETVVANDFSLYKGHDFMILTGPNMSGKTTFLRELALLQIMAQVGSFVPADVAVFRPADKILSRMGLSDSIESEASTAKTELIDFQHILKSHTKGSLILIDELARGTSPLEGTSLCWALLEPLVKSGAFVVVATHCHFLTRMADVYMNVFLMKLDVEEEKEDQDDVPKLKQTHKLTEGVTQVKHYGLLSAAEVLPKEIVAVALERAERLDARTAAQAENQQKSAFSKEKRELKIKHDMVRAVERLGELKAVLGWSEEEAWGKVGELKVKMEREMGQLARERVVVEDEDVWGDFPDDCFTPEEMAELYGESGNV